MATNKYPKGKGYTPNRPYSRTEDEAKKLGLKKDEAQKGTSIGIALKNSYRNGGNSADYNQISKSQKQDLFREYRQGPDRLRPKVRGSSTPIGRPTVAKPKKK